MIKLSVIVPIYNTAPFLERCVRSLMEQTLTKGIEFIFINDCSTDGSGELLSSILSEYPNSKHHIKTVSNTQNQGLGAVRALGFQLAEGEYITHCDSDDYMERDACQRICQQIEQSHADIILSDFYIHYLNWTETYHYPVLTFDQRLHHGLWWMLWSHTIRRSLLRNHQLTTIAGIDFWEDMDFLMRVYHFAQSLSYLPIPIYHYNKTNPNSLSREINLVERRKDCDRVISHLLAFYLDQGIQSPVRLLDLKRYARDLFLRQESIDWKQWKNTYPESWRYLWQDPQFRWGYRLTYTLASWGLTIPFRLYRYFSRKKCH